MVPPVHLAENDVSRRQTPNLPGEATERQVRHKWLFQKDILLQDAQGFARSLDGNGPVTGACAFAQVSVTEPSIARLVGGTGIEPVAPAV